MRISDWSSDVCSSDLIAEKDLELRGPGELLGTRQTGLAMFRVADLVRDADLLPLVHDIGERLQREAPGIADRLVERWIGGAARYASASVRWHTSGLCAGFGGSGVPTGACSPARPERKSVG